MVTYIHT